MRHQIWYVTKEHENPYGSPFDTKSEALETANELNNKPADGTLYVVKAVPPTDDLRAAAERLLALLDDENATKDITGVPLSLMAHNAKLHMGYLISRLELVRGFNRSGFWSLTEGRR